MNAAGRQLVMTRAGADPFGPVAAAAAAAGAAAVVTADPRVAGLSRPLGVIVAFGSAYYLKVGTGNSDWRLLATEKISVGVNSASQTFAALNGDLDGGYFLALNLVNSSGAAPLYTIRPNGLTTNQSTAFAEFTTSSITGSSTTTLYIGSGTNTAPLDTAFEVTLYSRTGKAREFFSRATRSSAAAIANITAGRWNESATNITSIEVVSSVAAGIGAGSKLTLIYLGNPLL